MFRPKHCNPTIVKQICYDPTDNIISVKLANNDFHTKKNSNSRKQDNSKTGTSLNYLIQTK